MDYQYLIIHYSYYSLNMQLFTIIYSLKKHYQEVKHANLPKIKSEIKHYSKNVQTMFYSPIYRTG